jgi:hypothetical protein
MRPQRVQGWREGGCYFLKKKVFYRALFFLKDGIGIPKGYQRKKIICLISYQ